MSGVGPRPRERARAKAAGASAGSEGIAPCGALLIRSAGARQQHNNKTQGRKDSHDSAALFPWLDDVAHDPCGVCVPGSTVFRSRHDPILPDGQVRLHVHALRERPGPPAGAVSGRQAPVRGQHAGQPPRDLPRREHGGSSTPRSVPVGLEPVAVAARSDDEVWVVNHLSDSVSIVELDAGRPQRRTSCARCSSATSRATSSSPGRGAKRAFITTAHRGQNIPFDPQLTTPGVGRADVWVFDADHLGSVARRHAAHHRHPVHATRRARSR